MKDVDGKKRGREIIWKNGEHDTKHSTIERYEHFDSIVLVIIDGREGKTFYFVRVLYNSKLYFIDCFDVLCIAELDNGSVIYYQRGKITSTRV